MSRFFLCSQMVDLRRWTSESEFLFDHYGSKSKSGFEATKWFALLIVILLSSSIMCVVSLGVFGDELMTWLNLCWIRACALLLHITHLYQLSPIKGNIRCAEIYKRVWTWLTLAEFQNLVFAQMKSLRLFCWCYHLIAALSLTQVVVMSPK